MQGADPKKESSPVTRVQGGGGLRLEPCPVAQDPCSLRPEPAQIKNKEKLLKT